MRLSKQEYEQVLYASEELANMQMKLDPKSYRIEVLQVLSEILGYNKSLFWIVDHSDNLIDPIRLNIEKKSLKTYLQHFYQLDFLQPFNLKKRNRIQKIDDIISFSNYQKTEYYNDFMKKNMLLDELAIYLEYKKQLVGVIGLIRDQDERKFNASDSVKLNFLMKHIENGFNVNRIIKDLENDQHLNLTAREKELVNYLEKGIKNKQIAKKLFISEHTVKKHLQNLFRKFDASNRTELLYKIKQK